MAYVPGLRSGYAQVGRLVYFGRMLDKIRLMAAGTLPSDYHGNLGIGFDGRCCSFLAVQYEALKTRVAQGGSDLDVLAWCHEQGGPRTDDQCIIWNRFMMKLGWRDERSSILQQRIVQFGLVGKPIETFFDLNDFDEDRDPVATRAWELRPPMAILIMGVSGSGKTTVGLKLAAALGWAFHDADDFHPAANVAKMSAGLPLDDVDRAPWLAAMRAAITSTLARGESAVFTCSALKEKYRDAVIADPARVKLVHLAGNFQLILERMRHREHFMRPEMLESQFRTLEAPGDALAVDIAQTPDQIVARIRGAFAL